MEKRKKKVFRYDRLFLYIFILITIILIVANYKLNSECVWSDMADNYVTKLTIVRK